MSKQVICIWDVVLQFTIAFAIQWFKGVPASILDFQASMAAPMAISLTLIALWRILVCKQFS